MHLADNAVPQLRAKLKNFANFDPFLKRFKGKALPAAVY